MTATVIAMPTDDRRRAHAFWAGALGFPAPGPPAEDGVPEPLEIELGGGAHLMLVPRGGFGWATGGRPLAEPGTVECLLGIARRSPAEVDDLVERARSGGAEVVVEPAEQPWGYVAVLADPDGHLLQVIAGG